MSTQCVAARLPADHQEGAPPVTIRALESVPTADLLYVRDQFAALAHHLPGNPLVRVRLTTVPGADQACTSVLQANLQIDGWLIARAHVATGDFRSASEAAAQTLGEHVRRAADHSTVRPWPEAGRAGRPQPAPLPASRREIRREKQVVPMRLDPVDAATVMDVMDYDFHLFVDAETGEDSVVYRVGPTGYRLARLECMALPNAAPGGVRWTVNVHGIPRLNTYQAVARLNDTDLPFRFFRHAATGRGAVIYRRLDGHYGLLAPTP